MSALFLLIGASILVAGTALAAFLWSIRDGQYEDEYTPSVRILFEEMNDTSDQQEIKQSTQTK